MLLSIAIPTYNRGPALGRTLACILPQLSAEVECVILDNASTDSTPDITAEARATSPFVRVIRHPINIGGNANILRCVEVAQGHWVWILPDDDVPYRDAVQRILTVVEQHADAVYVNFATSLLSALRLTRDKTLSNCGVSEFIASADSFSHLLFLTAGLYRREPLLCGLPLASRMVYTYSPHLALLLIALASNAELKSVQSHVAIADWRGPAEWDKEQLTRGAYHLLELLPKREDRIRFCRLIERDTPPFLARRGWASDVISSAAHADRDVLRRAIQRYSTIAALTGRFRTAAIASTLIDACSPLGSRWLCKALLKARGVTGRNKTPDAQSAMAAAVIAADRKM